VACARRGRTVGPVTSAARGDGQETVAADVAVDASPPAQLDAVDGAPAAVPLIAPREGVPAVIADPQALVDVVKAFAAGSGPVAVDAERASGYRYGQRAYLVQLRRAGAGTALVDPIGCPDLAGLADAISSAEWVLHAASQDIPCLAELGMRPAVLFDTELAGRLLGYPRVGLASIVESVLGFQLEKGHSAVDWSVRPLPEPWLRYAALDVEVLVELRDALEEQLRDQGKLDWARQEFAALVAAPLPRPRVEPWRRTSGVHRVRRPRQLAVVRALWETRDRIARERDVAPGRVLPDPAIVDAALKMPTSAQELGALPVYGGRSTRRSIEMWHAAIEAARSLPDQELPTPTVPSEGPPPARGWADKNPAAAERLATLRAAVAAIADEHGMPSENLLAPDTVRRIAWAPPAEISGEGVATVLTERGARAWQVELTALPIARALKRLRTRGEG
jgi:ribonuclease D